LSESSNNSELDIVIKEVKLRLKSIFMKRRELIIKLGNEFEKVVQKPESICEEIKIVLHEEITEHIISSRDIERYSLEKWKKKTKPQKNDKLSFLTKTEEQEKEEHMTIAIDTQGSPIDESISTMNKGHAYIKENICDLEPHGKLANIQNNATAMHTCPNCKKQLLIENQKIQDEKDAKIKQLEDEVQQYRNELRIKTSENAGMQAQIDHLKQQQQQVKEENNDSMPTSSSSSDTYSQLESSHIIDLEFSLKYEDVHKYVSSRLKVCGALGPLWFNCRLDKRTCRIIAAYPGRIVERTKSDDIDKGYNRND
jgi:DNA repair exonuclease SbcCD ATPase subunit